jgi:hypothetical protein
MTTVHRSVDQAMFKFFTTVVLACVLGVSAPEAQWRALSLAERDEDFVPLFNGMSLEGWETISLGTPTGAWYVRSDLFGLRPAVGIQDRT